MTFKTSITEHNQSSLERNRALVEHVLLALLPHGSGINCDWDFEWFDSGRVVARNVYSCMNETGHYCGNADFSVRVGELTPLDEFRLQFHGQQAQRLARRYELRGYLEDCISDCLPVATIRQILYWFNLHRAGCEHDAPHAVREAIASFKE